MSVLRNVTPPVDEIDSISYHCGDCGPNRPFPIRAPLLTRLIFAYKYESVGIDREIWRLATCQFDAEPTRSQ